MERLAAALHERQAADETRMREEASPGRTLLDAAPAEAIRALGVLAGNRDGGADRPGKGGATRQLAAALTGLHGMRGAA